MIRARIKRLFMSKRKIDKGALYYEIHGSGEPLLLISGLGADNSCWAGMVKRFSRRFQTIIFDNPGSGRSGLFRAPHTIRHMADGTVKLLDYLEIGRAHLIGLEAAL
jgi:pimeloyl-ACP methyl ester carboxylesterase